MPRVGASRLSLRSMRRGDRPWGIAGRIGLLLLTVVVTGCAGPPRPFQSNSGSGDPLARPVPQPSVIVMPVDGTANLVQADRFAEAMAGQLRRLDIPATVRVGSASSLFLVGRAEGWGDPSAPTDAPLPLAIDWHVIDGAGRPVGRHQQRLRVDRRRWRGGDDDLLTSLSASAAGPLARVMTDSEAAAAAGDVAAARAARSGAVCAPTETASSEFGLGRHCDSDFPRGHDGERHSPVVLPEASPPPGVAARAAAGAAFAPTQAAGSRHRRQRQPRGFARGKAKGRETGMGTQWDRAFPRLNHRGKRSTKTAETEGAGTASDRSDKPAGDTVLTVALAPVSGAPGSGNSDLTRALRDALGRRWVGITEAGGGDSGRALLTVTGTVTVHQPIAGNQAVEIVWLVRDSDGGVIGRISQANSVPVGSLDGDWFPIAPAIAEGAAVGLIRLVLEASGHRG